jgi:hypothetical protein
VPELNDTADIAERISQARKLFGSIIWRSSNYSATKTVDIRLVGFIKHLFVNIALWGSKSWALKEAYRSKPETFHHGCLRRMCGLTMWDVAEKRITNEQCKLTHHGLVDENAKMPMALYILFNARVKLSEANAWRMVYNATTSRETSAGHTALKILGFEWEKGQLREWMTIARDRSAWARKVE